MSELTPRFEELARLQPERAERLLTALTRSPARRGASLNTPAQMVEALRGAHIGQDKEHLWVAVVDRKLRLLALKALSVGTDCYTVMDNRMILRFALSVPDCNGIVVFHNHPMGDPDPSLEDTRATRSLHTACTQVGVRLVDHLVLADDSFVSMASRGLLCG